MRIKSILRGIVLLMLMLMLTLSACTLVQKETRAHKSSLYGQKQFCLRYLDQIIEDNYTKYCFNYPISAFTTDNSWYWLESNTYSISQNWKIEEVSEEDEYELDPTKPVVYLTFDDGPGRYTDRVLDILKEEDIKATFFVLGVQAERNPLFTKRIVDEGHTIGNHTYNHSYDDIYTSFDTFADQIYETNRIVFDLTGERMTIFRAPGGSINNLDEGYRAALEKAGLTLFDWNVDSRDSVIRGIESQDILKNITDTQLVNPAFVLLHDTSNNEQSLLALPYIIDYYKQNDYQFAPISASTAPVVFKIGNHLRWNRASVTEKQLLNMEKRMAELYE